MGLFNIFGSNSAAHSEGKTTKYSHRDAEYDKRLKAYKRAWEAYLAELPDPIAQDGPANDNVKVNPARAIVNTGVYFLFGNEVKFQVSPDAAERFGSGSTTAGNAPNTPTKTDKPEKSDKPDEDGPKAAKINSAESNAPLATPTPKYLTDLNKVWKANKKRSFLFNLGLSGGIHGDVFVKIVPNAAGDMNEYPRIISLDPANVDVHWDPNDCSRPLKFEISYVTEVENEQTGEVEPVMRIQEIKAVQDDAEERTLHWVMQDFEHAGAYINGLSMDFMPYDGEKVPVNEPTIWPYPWAPVDHAQNIELPHMFWGLPDLDESSIEVIESLQRSMSSLNKIVRVHASPRMFAKNVMPDQIDEIDVSADNIITLPNIDSELSVLETMSNLAPSIEYAKHQRSMLLEMVQVPPIALGEFETASTAISGVTLSILYAPLLQKTDLKRISYGDLLDRLNKKILILMGYEPKEFEDLIIVWPEAMPGSAYLERQTLEQDQMMGASQYTLLARLGYDPMEELKRKMEEVEKNLELQKKYAPEPPPGFGGSGGGETRGGNNNPSGAGNKSGSMGGTKAAGTPKRKPGEK